MTRKDYRVLAAALAAARKEKLADPDTINLAMSHIAEALAVDNPRFDLDKFFKASGFTWGAN